ncbi:hypothetical protein H6G74_17885 [Nostoc spongiaeforme FACHB-130]|uniref:Uncharacterized protein n=1 Tax=Nostoc spongiaeforme FACHB-130 TaxID=1357510 RepID=A0ABR8FXL3_9NOSO|nr:hypothetical protein [Nostoc spongiaeforme]MBD2596182.1 hypothetical protein [Nostoc spongiaeforme FACHB-130]
MMFKSSVFKIKNYQLWQQKILTTCAFSIILGMSQTALAGYEPPKDQKPPTGHSDSSGVRLGCKTNNRRSPSLIIGSAVTRTQPSNSITPSNQPRRNQNR